ncbi:3D-(3,5/4)-trihydroxycyclohexane-1,2-dione acylhydrolase (decyclizing) [Mycoplasmoides fastidiosum]|uniref:3D-(3,5/4)-trihydroxycyclohexane-1,2-dione acylhydrolase (Decyclizing) n=1 Tax=Mycoplasmoides fastidiosum TaxID=92758 RepID=A0ABU0LZI6_9BACT|nr:3D-(3,5/4)-trihydroxycyclohexane-1,2-dione acylhydrolase (decyclizing) [Mycoplasmoides fastidiosum]MDQ0514116.1 3D-(3,5/4)-trihydroxycyclohexane-1,2-dione acylhydrolase (decyclizing) [Mycoplasmoides fastidiosum]UUD37476.1 3D-(3,5/4)-trihydroxycyclohexane-1,2-dione acylhydrolase (decyclizing) [Mycoplasmoides fastidiosum]
MKTIRCTTAQAIVKYLNQVYLQVDDNRPKKYVTGFATIFGHGNVLGLGEALSHEFHSFYLYQGKNEQAMAHVALGFTKQTNRQQIMACSSSVGPGAANLVTAAATATANHLPLLLLPGDVFASAKPDPVLQQIEQTHDLGISTNDAFKPVCRYFARISRPEQVIKFLPQAIQVLTNPATTGAVCVALAQDVQGETYDFPEWFFEPTTIQVDRFTTSETKINYAFTRLAKAKQPLVIVGGGVRYSQAGEQVVAFCKKHFIPFVTTQAGASSVPSSEPLNLGGIGVTGNLQANLYAQKVDFVLGIGTKYSDFTTGSKQLFSEKTYFVNININRFDSQKMRGFGLVGDALAIVNQLLHADTNINFQTKLEPVLQKVKKRWITELNRLQQLDQPLQNLEIQDTNLQSVIEFEKAIHNHYKNRPVQIFHQAQLVQLLNHHLNDQIIYGAAGSLPGDLQRLWQTDRIDSYNLEYGYSCMGHEIQAAIGASLVSNLQPTFAFCGDGSFLMLHSELHTAVASGIPVVVLLFDNSGFGCINNLQLAYQKRSLATEFRSGHPGLNFKTDFMVTEFATIAQGYGVDAHLVESTEHLLVLLEKAKKTTRPMLIEMKVYPKTMTHGYECAWEVGAAQSSFQSETEAAAAETYDYFKTHKFN